MVQPKDLLDRAEAFADGGDHDFAAVLLRKVVTDFPESNEATVAQRSLLSSAVRGRRHALPRVRVADIDISFGSMVVLFVKAAFAAIPAAIVISVVWVALGLVLGGVGLGVR